VSSPLDALVGGMASPSTWSGGIAPTKSITDQSDHIDGGSLRSANGTNAASPDHARSVMFYAAAIVLGALALLWLSGGITLRSARL
jgi:hypothetical protein